MKYQQEIVIAVNRQVFLNEIIFRFHIKFGIRLTYARERKLLHNTLQPAGLATAAL